MEIQLTRVDGCPITNKKQELQLRKEPLHILITLEIVYKPTLINLFCSEVLLFLTKS
jgi:hypothetical protein